MAAFLNGLMGALKGIGSSLGSGASKLGNGLMGSIDGATGHPGAAGVYANAGSDVGNFKFGPGLSVQGAQDGAIPAAKPGFFTRINTADPTTGLSTVDKWDRLGARLQDISDGGDRSKSVDARAAGRLSKDRQSLLNSQIDTMFSDDPKMRFLLKANPEKATEALAGVYKSRNEAANVPAGDTRVFGDPTHGASTFMAPKFGVDDGYAYRVGPDGFQWGDQRGPTHGEQETGRHNLAEEGIGWGNVGVARGNLGVSRDRLGFDRSKEASAGGGAGGSLGHLSTEQLIAALRGGR